MASEKNKSIVANYDSTARTSFLDILSSGRYASSAFGYAGRLGRFLAEKMELAPSDRVLDAGCNAGVYHPALARRAGRLVGVDASPHAVERARARHKDLANAQYQVGDLTELKPSDFAFRFDKILCYSVVHILGDITELEILLRNFIGLLDGGHGMIFLGEVREKELYDRFQEDLKNRKGMSLRDLRFKALKYLQKFLIPGDSTSKGQPPTLYRRQEIEDLVKRLGGRVERLEQADWHPFYNTCADYILRF